MKNNITCWYYTNLFGCKKGDMCDFNHSKECMIQARKNMRFDCNLSLKCPTKCPGRHNIKIDVENTSILGKRKFDDINNQNTYLKSQVEKEYNYGLRCENFIKLLKEDNKDYNKQVSNLKIEMDALKKNNYNINNAFLESINYNMELKNEIKELHKELAHFRNK